MPIKYICEGFDNNFYNFDAFVVPLQWSFNKQYTKNVPLNISSDPFGYVKDYLQNIDFIFPHQAKIIKIKDSNAYYIFVRGEEGFSFKCDYYKHYYDMIFECIKIKNFRRVAMYPFLNKFIIDFKETDEKYHFFEEFYDKHFGKYDYTTIYAIVKPEIYRMERTNIRAEAVLNFEAGKISNEEYRKILLGLELEEFNSYTREVLRRAEVETMFQQKVLADALMEIENLKCSPEVVPEYMKVYKKNDSELAKAAFVNKSTISKMKNGKFGNIERDTVIAVALALGLNQKERIRFINCAGLYYPYSQKEKLIEEELKQKIYHTVQEFNEANPDIAIETKQYMKFINEK